MVHAAIAEQTVGLEPATIETRYQDAVAAAQLPWDTDVLREIQALDVWLNHFYAAHSILPEDVIAVEEPLSAPLGTVEGEAVQIVGTPDAVIWSDGALWHRQIKTRGASGGQHNYARTRASSLHELVYAYLITEAYDGDYGGTVLVTITKATRQKRQNGRSGPLIDRNPEECVSVEFLPIDGAQVERALDDIRAATADLLGIKRRAAHSSPLTAFGYDGSPYWPVGVVAHRDSCLGRFGSLCGFYDTCFGRVPITADGIYTDWSPRRHYEEESYAHCAPA